MKSMSQSLLLPGESPNMFAAERVAVTSFSVIVTAADFAARAHRGQTRKGRSRRPYIEHVLAVTSTLSTHGIDDPVTLAAALLHDTIEDCGLTRDGLAAVFGDHIADVVLEVSDDPRLPLRSRRLLQIHEAPGLSHEARLVKLADKINNVREVAIDPGEGWDEARRRDYVAWSQQVVAAMPPTHSALEKLFADECATTLAVISANERAGTPG